MENVHVWIYIDLHADLQGWLIKHVSMPCPAAGNVTYLTLNEVLLFVIVIYDSIVTHSVDYPGSMKDRYK